jgi:hypothetical protein
MSPYQIAQQWLDAEKMREEARQLSNKRLSKKFERNVRTITKVANKTPCQVPDDEQILIRQCVAERDRLKSEASKYTIVGLCRRYNIGRESFVAALIEMGAWEPES